MVAVFARPWFLAGYLHLGAAAALGLVAAAPSTAIDPWTHVLVALAGVLLIVGALTHGFVSPFLKREPRTALLAHSSLVLVLVADALALLAAPVARVTLADALLVYAAAFALLPLHVLLTALAGTPWRGGVALFAKDQPFRHGDVVAATAMGAGLLGVLAGAALLAFPPRGIPTTGVLVALLGGAVPSLGGFLLFILPRNAKQPLPGITLHAAALGLLLAGVFGLAVGFAFPVDARLRIPGVMVALAHALSLVALLRLGLAERTGAQLARARPFLRAAFALAALAPMALVFGTLADSTAAELAPTTSFEYQRAALYAYLLLAATLGVAGTLFGAPILLNAVPRAGRWGAIVAAVAIAGLFLLAGALLNGQSTFPSAVVLAAGAAIALWGLAPLRQPRRDCD